MTMDKRSEIYADAIIVAMTETANEIGQPDINAALAALVYAQAYLLAKLPPIEREAAHAVCVNQLVAQTKEFAAFNQPPAGHA